MSKTPAEPSTGEREAFEAELRKMPEWSPEFEIHRAWVTSFAWGLWQARADLAAQAPSPVPTEHALLQVENFALESAAGHLGSLVDEVRSLLGRAMQAMKTLHESATPDDTEDMDAIIPAAAFRAFVDEHARLLYEIANGCAQAPSPVAPSEPRGPVIHELKTDPAVFEAVWNGSKTFEIRYNDRDFKVGDSLYLLETKYSGAQMRDGLPLEYTDRTQMKVVSHVLHGYGLMPGWCCLSFRAAIPAAPVAPSEPAYYVSGPYFDGSMSVCELTTGKILHKFRLDSAAIPDAPVAPSDDMNPIKEGWQISVTSGHSGYGVYAHMSEYPEEGAVLVAAIPDAVAPSEPMFMAAVSALAEISVALGIPDDEAACANGNDLILERIAELHAAQAPSPVAPSEHICGICFNDPERCDIHDCGDMHERAAIPDEKAKPMTLNGEAPTAHNLLAALVDIYDDSQSIAPEHRCYVPEAWGDVLAQARAFLAAPIQPRQAEPPLITAMIDARREQYALDQTCTPAFLHWLDTMTPRAGVGANEAWNAGVEWQKSQRAAIPDAEPDKRLAHALQHAKVAVQFIVDGAKARPDLMCGYWDDACTHAEIAVKDLEAIVAKERAAIPAAPVAPSEPAAQQAIDALEAAKNGLEWYRDARPMLTDGSDDEMDAQIDAAVLALRAAIPDEKADK